MKRFVVLLAALLLSFQTHAALVSGNIIGPTLVQEDSPTNTEQQGFNEKQSVYLTSAINVDGGTVAAGQTVDSHLIFLNSEGSSFVSDYQIWGFDGEILGVMSNSNGSLMTATDSLFALGAYFTDKSSPTFAAKGLENNDSYSLISNFLLGVDMKVTEPGDWIRVITASAVPVPAAILLFAPALLGFLGLRRKAKV